MNTMSALVVVDVQKGFSSLCPDELPVPDALDTVAPINELLDLPWFHIAATQDWHPADHCSFKGQEKDIYPPHCIGNTPGADFLPGLNTHKFHSIWRKGYDKKKEAYSVVSQHPFLRDAFVAANVENVFVCGIATNICVLQTAMGFKVIPDPRKKGPSPKTFNVYIIEDASAGIDIPNIADQVKDKGYGERSGIRYTTVKKVRELVK